MPVYRKSKNSNSNLFSQDFCFKRLLCTLLLVFSNLSLGVFASDLSSMKLLFNFQGKGSSLAYDAGAFTTAFEMIPAISEEKVILTGNSGGSILTSYFVCHGITEQSVGKLREVLLEGSDKIKRSVAYLRQTVENQGGKADMFSEGLIPYIPISNLDPYIEAALGISSIADLTKAPCKFAVPFVIVAGNFEVVNNLAPTIRLAEMKAVAKDSKEGQIKAMPPDLLSGRKEKVFKEDDFSIHWKPRIYDQLKTLYQTAQGQAALKQSHPDLKPGPSEYIGKSCTYFLSPDLFKLLSAVPSAKRLCDLRLVDSALGLALAIQASAAEPTYFPPVVDPDPSKLLVVDGKPGDLGQSTRRSYWGGFIMPMTAADFRLALPHIYVVGSGLVRLNVFASYGLSGLVLVDSTVISPISEYWADTSFLPERSLIDKLTSLNAARPPQQIEFAQGRARARYCLEAEKNKTGHCLPENVSYPAIDTPAFPSEEFPEDESLEGRRGISELL